MQMRMSRGYAKEVGDVTAEFSQGDDWLASGRSGHVGGLICHLRGEVSALACAKGGSGFSLVVEALSSISSIPDGSKFQELR